MTDYRLRDDIEPDPADVLSIASSVPVPGLCNVGGCVYLAGHESFDDPRELHSWARPAIALP